VTERSFLRDFLVFFVTEDTLPFASLPYLEMSTEAFELFCRKGLAFPDFVVFFCFANILDSSCKCVKAAAILKKCEDPSYFWIKKEFSPSFSSMVFSLYIKCPWTFSGTVI
jgi:hypothetical protein